MKAFNFFLIFSFALIFIQCKEKSDQENIPDMESDKELNPAENFGTISVTVYDYNSTNGMSDVLIEIQRRGVITGHDTTNVSGEATLTAVASDNEYTFSKQGFTSQIIQFTDYTDIHTVFVHLKPTEANTSPAMNIRGVVYSSAGSPAKNVIVRSDGSNAKSHQDGSYSIDIQSEDGAFPLDFVQGAIKGGLSMKTNEDTVIIDVFIDGFTDDSISIK